MADYETPRKVTITDQPEIRTGVDLPVYPSFLEGAGPTFFMHGLPIILPHHPSPCQLQLSSSIHGRMRGLFKRYYPGLNVKPEILIRDYIQ